MVMLIAVVLGVSMGRNRRADLVIRPFLDAFQVLPPFVYLVPALALFGVGRFTAIMAAVAYAVPIATKLVADGIRGVSPTTVEAARSSGSTGWQMITKVQLPMAREALVLAANQGLLYVLAMVVIGGMVGGRQPRLHRGLRLQPGPAVRQGSRRGHRHRRARDHDRPDRAVRRRCGTAGEDDFRGPTRSKERKNHGTRTTPLLAHRPCHVRGPRPGRMRRGQHRVERHRGR